MFISKELTQSKSTEFKQGRKTGLRTRKGAKTEEGEATNLQEIHATSIVQYMEKAKNTLPRIIRTSSL